MKNQHDIEHLRFKSRDLYDALDVALELISELVENLEGTGWDHSHRKLITRANTFLKEYK